MKWYKILLFILIIASLGLIVVSLVENFVGANGQPGLSNKQILMIIMGSAGLILSVLMMRTSDMANLYYKKWQQPPDIREVPASIFLFSIWFGLLTGLVEVIVLVYRKLVDGWNLFLDSKLVWMAPLADLVLFLCFGLVFYLVARRYHRFFSSKVFFGLFSFISYLIVLLMFPALNKFAALLLALGLGVQTGLLIARHTKVFYFIVWHTMSWGALRNYLKFKKKANTLIDPQENEFYFSRRDFLITSGLLLGGLLLGERAWSKVGEKKKLSKLSPSSPNSPNVLLIVLDTVRAKSLSLNGYKRRTTPRLERLAKKGVLFERAISTSPWTLPSHVSIFTGRYNYEVSADYWIPLDATWPTLAEYLSLHGYLTAGFVANLIYCGYEYGLNRGFAHYEDYPISPGQISLSSSLGRTVASSDRLRNITGYHELINRKDAASVNSSFLRWLSIQDQQRPFFAFLNYFDAHEPYLPPKPFDEQFGPKRAYGAEFFHMAHFATRRAKWTMSSSQIQEELDAYEGAIAYLDHQVGLLIDELEKRALLDNTLLIITSDHGEHFGEKRLFDHGTSLYLPLLHVPLLISFPRRVPAGVSIPDTITLRDLPATVTELLSLGKDAPFPGVSLGQHWNKASEIDNSAVSPVMAELKNEGGRPEWYPSMKGYMKSLINDNLHYIQNGDGSEELYDLDKDPSELQDIAGIVGEDVLKVFRHSLESILDNG